MLAPCVEVNVAEIVMALGTVAAVAVWSATVAWQRLATTERAAGSGGRMLRALADLVARRG